MTFILFTGLPGSGKTTAARMLYAELQDSTCVEYISSDDIRKEVNGDASSQENGHIVWDLFYRKAIESSAECVILDATFLKAKDRKHAFHKLDKCGRDFCAVSILPNVELSKKRNSERERVVPDEVIDKMYLTYTLPGISENFIRIYYLNPEDLTLYAELRK